MRTTAEATRLRSSEEPALAVGWAALSWGPISDGPRAQPAEAAVAPAVLGDGGPEDRVVEVGPVIGNEDEFRIGRLPGQEVRDALLSGGADHQIRIGDAPGIEFGVQGVEV